MDTTTTPAVNYQTKKKWLFIVSLLIAFILETFAYGACVEVFLLYEPQWLSPTAGAAFSLSVFVSFLLFLVGQGMFINRSWYVIAGFTFGVSVISGLILIPIAPNAIFPLGLGPTSYIIFALLVYGVFLRFHREFSAIDDIWSPIVPSFRRRD